MVPGNTSRLPEYRSTKPSRANTAILCRAAANFRHWKKLLASAKLAAHCTVHGLRHSYASALRRRGADLLEIRDALGHHSLVQTERYMHRLETESSRVANLIEAAPIQHVPLFKGIKP